MQGGDELMMDAAVSEIAALLATAYRRRAEIRLIQPEAEPLRSTEALENRTETRPHELTLTAQRKEQRLQ
jgi:hypothetical protein